MPIDARSLPSPPQSRATFSWFLLISANVLWATSSVAGKLALQNTLVILMLALRMGISALILLPLLITSASIFTAALSWIVLREQVRKRTAFVLLLGFVGVYLIIERSLFPNLPTASVYVISNI